ncbi:MAG: c-type cytochrome [Candidatus Competibacteraceae bacterium]|nr:c-type cytochrome [Candidatus Competibacteraceae bacterium]
MKTTQTISVATLLSGLIWASLSAQAADSSEPIKIALNNWPSQQVLSYITGELLTQMGYSVDYRPTDAQLQFQALGNGDLHVQMEIWQGTMQTPFEQQIERGRMQEAGSHSAITREEWWYPEYVSQLCPGLPDWQALNNCAELFATPETTPHGRYLAGPRDWERPDRERVEALGLHYQVVPVEHAEQLWAALDQAIRHQQAILLMNWTPNWTQAKYQGEFVHFPDYAPPCETDPSWGTNPKLTFDCGNPATGWLKKGVWQGFPEQWSCAFELIQTINFDNHQISAAAAYVGVDEMSPEEAARRWLAENQTVWSAWMPDCTQTLSLTTSESAPVAPGSTTAAAAAPDNDAAEALAKQSNCLACHSVAQKLVGPAFNDIAAKYPSDDATVQQLSDKVKNGGSGAWGEIPMPPNPTVSEENIRTLVKWILLLDAN